MLEKLEYLLTCTMYWTALPLGLPDADHCRVYEQPEKLEHFASGSATSTGADGGLVLVEPLETTNESVVDQEDTRDVLAALRA